MTRTTISLDGDWGFWPVDDSVTAPAVAGGVAPHTVEVPSVWQHYDALRFHQGAAFYRTDFDAPDLAANERLFVHFGAVDWSADVWVNGILVGSNDNGWLPFEFDVTDAAVPGRNILVVRVGDPIDDFAGLPHGKQSWYGLLSGIWQSVRVEVRNAQHIQSVKVNTHGEGGSSVAKVSVALSKTLGEGQKIAYRLLGPDGSVINEESAPNTEVSIGVPNPLLWDIGQGNLYTIEVSLLDANGAALDAQSDTFGFRTIRTEGGKILLNDKPYYMRGVLDQDYYPDTDSVPPSQEFIEDQFKLALATGYNCFRVHIKVADPRYYAAADKVGMLIWTEIPNQQEFSGKASKRAEQTLWGFIERDWNRPSVLIRTIINESWGIDLTSSEQRQWLADTVRAARAADPSRLVVGNSACCHNFQVVTDVEDFHMYMVQPDKHGPWRSWVENFATHPEWTYAHEYTTIDAWREFNKNSRDFKGTPAAENERAGDEPLLLSEYGNWGLPDVDRLIEEYGGEPWWFEWGSDRGNGEVYPHGIHNRFDLYNLRRAFPSLGALTHASRLGQGEAMKFETEQIRKQAPIQGYIVTEWSDLNWECNGVVDMRRNPKEVLFSMRPANQDVVIVPDWTRLAYRSGETVSLPLYVSFYNEVAGSDYKIVWNLAGTDAAGTLNAATPLAYDVVNAGTLEFVLPDVATGARHRLHLALQDAAGTQHASNWLDLYVAPATSSVHGATLSSDSLADKLGALGYNVQSNDADIIVTKTLTDAHRAHLHAGGKVLLLAEEADAVQTHIPRLAVVGREGTKWQGDWAQGDCWISQDKVFSNLTDTGLMDFVFADIMPRNVMPWVEQIDFLNRVHAGLYVGWLHHAAATVLERRVGRGVLLVSTLRLAPNLEKNPLAQSLLDQMVTYLAGLSDTY